MRHFFYLLYGVVVIIVCTWVNASDMQERNASRGWSGGGRTSGGGWVGSANGGGGGHK